MPTYRYQTSDKSALTAQEEAEYGNIMQSSDVNELTLAGGRKVSRSPDTTNLSTMPINPSRERNRYAVNTVGEAAETTPDPTAAYYDTIKSQSAMPTEARRSELRAQAQQDVQDQITAINSAYMDLIGQEQQRQEKSAKLGAAQVSGIGRLSGLGGSSVQAARQGTQQTLATEAERAAVRALQSQQAAEATRVRGGATASAEARFAQEQALAQQAQGQYGAYIQSLATKPKAGAASPVEVGGYLVDPATGKVIFAPPDKATTTTYTLKPGETVFGPDGRVIASVPANATAEKAFTLSPGEVAYSADGREIARGGAKTADAKAPEVRETSGGLIQWNPMTGGWEPILVNGLTVGGKNTSADIKTSVVEVGGRKLLVNDATGDTVKDLGTTTKEETPANLAEKAVVQAEKVAALNEKISLVDELLGPDEKGGKGLYGSVGSYGLTRWTPFTPDAADRQNFHAGVQQLISQGTLDALLNLKAQGGTLGALSEGEKAMLQAAASKIGTWTDKDKSGNMTGVYNTSKENMLLELKRIKDLTMKAISRAQGATRPVLPAGNADLDAALDSVGFSGVGGGTVNARKVASAIGQFESGGNYKALGPVLNSGMYKGDRAYGKYQVMGKNVPSWTKEALGVAMTPQQFLADTRAQDAVAEFRMGRLAAQGHGVEDIASIWFSGQPLAKAGGKKDQLGTTVPGYAKNIRAIYNRA